jgi:hypothetical protein
VRVPGGSPSLLGLGLAAIALGIGLDYVLAVVLDAVRKTCRVVVVPHHGKRLCVEGLDPTAADVALARVAMSLSAVRDDPPPSSAQDDATTAAPTS